MPRRSRLTAASLVLPGVMLLLAGGCSSTAMPIGDGDGGATGGGGAGGPIEIQDAGLQDAGDHCAALLAAYAAAYSSALDCDPAVNRIQCAQEASPSLACPSCMFRVNDATVLDQIRAQWDNATDLRCPPLPCPAIACPAPGTGVCVPNDGGATGTCMTTYQ